MKPTLLFISALLVSYSGIAQLSKGLVAKYSFNNGNANDEAGNNNGKVVGAELTTDRFGKPNHAYHFDGTQGKYINLGTSNKLKPISGTISLWASVDSASNGTGIPAAPLILTKVCPGHNYYEAYGIYFRITDSTFAVNSTDSGTTIQPNINTLNPIKYHTWNHIVYTFTDDSMQLFLDGVLQNTCKKGFKTKYLSTDSVIVGYSCDTQNDMAFNGSIDDISIYDRVLSIKEIDSLYKAKDNSAGITISRKPETVSFPNPFGEQLSVISSEKISKIVLVDMQGRSIYSSCSNQDNLLIPTGHLQEGMYFLHLTLTNGEVIKYKAIKSK